MKQYSRFLSTPTSDVAHLVVVDACDDEQARVAVAAILRTNSRCTLAEVYDDDMRMFDMRHAKLASDAPMSAGGKLHISGKAFWLSRRG